MSSEPDVGTCAGCIFPADAVVTVGCVHEHVTVIAACEGRITELRRSQGYMTCAPCEEAGEVIAPLITARWPDGRTEVIQEAGDFRVPLEG